MTIFFQVSALVVKNADLISKPRNSVKKIIRKFK